MTGELARAPNLFESLPGGLIFILALLLIWASGAFRDLVPAVAPARQPTVRLGRPSLVAMSPADAADAARLLGSSVAAQVAEWRQP